VFGLINRGSLPPVVEDEFEHLVARLKSVWLAGHNEDGSHSLSLGSDSLTPVGSITMWPTATAPTAWKICNGQQLSRLKYKDLFDVISVTYGAGDGSTTFNVPDIRQRVVLGLATAGTGSTLAGTGGAVDHTHAVGTLAVASHTHGVGSLGVDSHTHGDGTLAVASHSHDDGTLGVASHTHSVDPPNTTSSAISASHTHLVAGTTGVNSGSTVVEAFSTTPVTVASDGHTHSHSETSDAQSGGHTHDVDIGSFTSGSDAPDVTGNTGSTAPDVTGATAGATATISGATAGTAPSLSGSSDTANPPFIAMPYIIHTGVPT
jgi:microcystin-dependent protein